MIGGGAWFICKNPMFNFTTVILEESQLGKPKHVTSESITKEALPRIKGNFFTANLDQVRDSVAAVPWVREAKVRREWPNHLYVQVEEHKPFGSWGDGDHLISVKGELFTANVAEAEEDIGQIPEFAGPDGTQEEVLAKYQVFKEIFKPIGLVPNGVKLSPRYSWTVKLSNGTQVELGRDQKRGEVDTRLKRFIAVYPQITAKFQDKIDSVDLRYPAGLTIKGPGVVIKPDAPKK